MKLSDFRGDEAYQVIADLMDPVAEITTDEALANMRKSDTRLKTAQYIIRTHKQSINTILAILDRKNPETYELNRAQLLIKVLELLNDRELLRLFQ